ncbi:MAG: hypothetical protein ACLSF5_03300 [Blautia massiliensis (ex Durand et al. 2017)]
MSIVSKEDLLNKQTEAKNTLKSFTCRVLVCSGTGCMLPAHRRFTTK